MPDPRIEPFRTDGLGDSTYLVAAGDEAVLVDPQRDAWRFLDVARERGWRVRYVLETHVHNDYVSGALEVAAAVGASVVAPASGGYEFAHLGLEPGEDVRIGDVRLVARATPGHTPEHLAWDAVRDGEDEPDAVFTGGSLLVGGAGRTDLLGPDRTAELTAAQFASLRSLARLPDRVRVLPTHGSGSFCVGGSADAATTSTLGRERATNPLLAAADLDEFGRLLLDGAGRYPAYYARMAPINRAGPAVLRGTPGVPRLDPAALAARVAAGARLVDGRPRKAFAAAHIPGSVNVELRDSFGSYVGWLVPHRSPVVLVLPEPLDDAAMEAAVQLFRIGWDDVGGVLEGGLEAWAAAGRETASYPVTTMPEVRAAADRGEAGPVLDVRQPTEWAETGSLPGAGQVFVADLADLAASPELDEQVRALAADGRLTVHCRTGHRAAMAASLLDRAGLPVRLVARGGL